MTRSPLLLALATCNALRSQRPPTLLRARPDDCPEDVWERIVEAEQKSREKKGQIGAALWGLDKGAIEQNQLRIWEELKERQAVVLNVFEYFIVEMIVGSNHIVRSAKLRT